MKQRRENSVQISPNWNLNVKVLELPGPEYGSNEDDRFKQFRRLMQDLAIEADPRYLVVDLSRVHYFGASFIGVLVKAWDQLQKQQRHLVICGLTPFCARLIQILHLDKLFEIYPTLRVVMDKIGHPTPGPNENAKFGEIRIEESEVDWDSNMVRLEYIGDDRVPIRSVIVPRANRS